MSPNEEVFSPGYLPPEEESPALWFIFQDRKMLVETANGRPAPPVALHPEDLGLKTGRVHYLGNLGDRPCFAADAAPGIPAPPGLAWMDMYRVYMDSAPDLFRVAGRALQVVDWDRTRRYCSACGRLLVLDDRERVKVCRGCGRQVFPRLSPAVIVAVSRGPEILLARSPRFPGGMFSTIAGFVEAGETLEETVAREVREETGIRVEGITYFASQHWPFPDSLMVGFTARWHSGDIEVDGVEVVEAGWFGTANLPKLPRGNSIARKLINHTLGLTGDGDQ